jgi:hypothetical protein
MRLASQTLRKYLLELEHLTSLLVLVVLKFFLLQAEAVVVAPTLVLAAGVVGKLFEDF